MKRFVSFRQNFALGLLFLTPVLGLAKTPWPQPLLHDFSQIPAFAGSPEVIQALCPDASTSKEVWEKDAGKDDLGHSLKVARVARLTQDPNDTKCDTCHMVGETWSVAISPKGAVEKRLMEKDAFADRLEMEPESPGNLPGFQISPNQLTITTESSRGSWGGTTTWQLFPQIVLKESWSHVIPAGGADTKPPFFNATWDWRTPAGSGSGSGAMEQRRDCKSKAKGKAGQFLIIPMLPYGDAFIQKSWKEIDLGESSLKVTGKNAFVLAGRPEKGLVMKVALASPKDLFVEIPKTKFTTSASNWLYSDHLEIWQAGDDVGFDPTFSAVQWGIQLGDGKVYAAHGDPKDLPDVEKAVEQQGVGRPPVTVLHIRLSRPVDDFGFLTVSYSASLKGHKVGSLLSTSHLCFGMGETLGLVKKIDFAAAGY